MHGLEIVQLITTARKDSTLQVFVFGLTALGGGGGRGAAITMLLISAYNSPH